MPLCAPSRYLVSPRGVVRLWDCSSHAKSEEHRDKGINENLLLVRIRMNLIPPEVEFFTDPELEETPYDTIYGALPNGKEWKLKPRAGDVQLASELLNDEEDDYYYEDY